ncbi:polysaccharide biosynthesis C-terminal domain-containing protein [Algiphilus sp.]|uniref:oligosaccharide flippase family protein n=1 Tax=Algiphilus sp. TaxID=1872431 RepID=UPI003C7CB16D
MRVAKPQLYFGTMLKSLVSAAIVLPLGLAANFVMHLVVARALPEAGYGIFSFAISLSSVLALGAALGTSVSMMRYLGPLIDSRRLHEANGLISSTRKLIAFSASFVAICMFSLSNNNSDLQGGLYWASLLLLPFTLDLWRESCMRGLHKTVSAISPRQLLLPIVMCIIITAAGLRTEWEVMAAFFVSLCLVTIAAFIHMHFATSHIREYCAEDVGYGWLRTSVPMGIASLALLGICRWDLVILGAFVNMDQVGLYAAAARLSLLAAVVLRIVNLVVAPFLAQAYHAGRLVDFRRLLKISTIGAALVGSPLFFGIVIWSEELLALFGHGYVGATLELRILALGQYINLLTGPVSFALTMSRHERANMLLNILAAAVSLIGLLILVPLLGSVGAAIATTLALSCLNISQLALCTYLFKVRR